MRAKSKGLPSQFSLRQVFQNSNLDSITCDRSDRTLVELTVWLGASEMADVFISYKRRLRSRVEEIAAILRSYHLDVWFDASLEPGQSFSSEIGAEVRTARCVLVLWSNDALAHGGDVSGWVVGEATIGRERKALVSATLEPTDFDPPWNTVHTEDLAGWSPSTSGRERSNWQKVLSAIGGLTDRPGLGDYDRATQLGSSDALAEWARKYPTDPLAKMVPARIDWNARLAGDSPAETAAVERSEPTRTITVIYPSIFGLLAVAILIGWTWQNGYINLDGFISHNSLAPMTGSAAKVALPEVAGPASELPSAPPSIRGSVIDLGPENVTTLAKTSTKEQTGLGRTERIVTILEATTLDVVLAKNGFNSAMIEALNATLVDSFKGPLPVRAHLRILFGASRTSDTLIPYRLSIYLHEEATNTDKHAVTVALTDRGTYALALAPSPITLPGSAPIEPAHVNGSSSGIAAPKKGDRARPNP